MTLQKIEISFSLDALNRINELGLDRNDIEVRIRKEYGDVPVFPPKKTDIVIDFKSSKTWQQYLIIGFVKQKGSTGLVTVTGMGEKVGATSSDGVAKVYKLNNVEGGITLREHIANLKKRRQEENKK